MERVDLIDVCIPRLLAAVRAGKHVLCEKTLALTFAQANEMWKTAEEAGVGASDLSQLTIRTGRSVGKKVD